MRRSTTISAGPRFCSGIVPAGSRNYAHRQGKSRKALTPDAKMAFLIEIRNGHSYRTVTFRE
jgi:hypothetical protein